MQHNLRISVMMDKHHLRAIPPPILNASHPPKQTNKPTRDLWMWGFHTCVCKSGRGARLPVDPGRPAQAHARMVDEDGSGTMDEEEFVSHCISAFQNAGAFGAGGGGGGSSAAARPAPTGAVKISGDPAREVAVGTVLRALTPLQETELSGGRGMDCRLIRSGCLCGLPGIVTCGFRWMDEMGCFGAPVVRTLTTLETGDWGLLLGKGSHPPPLAMLSESDC